MAVVVLAGLDLPVVAGMAWVAVLASGSQSHVPWEVDNQYAQHMSYPSREQLALLDMMVGGPDVLGCVVVVGCCSQVEGQGLVD